MEAFGTGVSGVARMAEELEKLKKPFIQLKLIGYMFLLVSVAASGLKLMAKGRDGRERLEVARSEWWDASVTFTRWLVGLLASGFKDEKRLWPGSLTCLSSAGMWPQVSRTRCSGCGRNAHGKRRRLM